MRIKLSTICFLDQSSAVREEKVLCRIMPWGIYIGTRTNEFIPMHRVLRIFIHK